MARYKLTFVFIQALVSFSLCEIDLQKKGRLANGFVDFYNNLPNRLFMCDEGFLESAQQTDISNAYDIGISLKVSDIHNLEITKYIKCTATVADLDVGVAVMKHHCQDDLNPAKNPENIEEKIITESHLVTETPFIRKPIQLDNEVQTDTAVTSGEQFVAIPREEPKVHCIGCSSHVNPQAEGVTELADIGIRQLNSLEPNIQHTLNSVIDVERQVQVVNGVRYILTLLVDYNRCSTAETDPCLTSKACKITVLEKPWMQLPDGTKYRAILSNNCTEQWQFGDDGAVVSRSDNKESNIINGTNSDGSTDEIKATHNVDVQSQLHTDKTLTEQDVKKIEEQIIPLTQFTTEPTITASATSFTPDTSDLSKEHVVKLESENQFSSNSIQSSKPQKVQNLDEDKKKSIDELMNFFNFAGLDSSFNNDDVSRMKRSFNSDLNVLKLAEKFKKIKKNIENAKRIYELSQNVVDYLNEMDLEVKDRVLKDVTNAEEESDDHSHFYYIQFRTAIPCKTNDCETINKANKICNAIIDNSERLPHILNVFCHDEEEKRHGGMEQTVPINDPKLLKMIQESMKKMESESQNEKALYLNKVIDASVQIVSGTLTKLSIALDRTDCKKSVPFTLRSNCTVVDDYGSQICDVTIYERHWLKDKSISYICTDRPIDIRFSQNKKNAMLKSPNDPVVLDMVQEALLNLEEQSNRNNKQIVLKINSVSTQLVAGFLTKIEFVVGYTTCPSYIKIEKSNRCRLLDHEPLKICTAKVWDRTWLEGGRKVEVSCKDHGIGNLVSHRTKRAIQLVGETKDKSVDDSKIKALVNESLQKFMLTSGTRTHYSLLKITRATSQIVAGTLYNVYFKIAPTDCRIDDKEIPTASKCNVINSKKTSCHSKISERPWLNEKTINVTCDIENTSNREKRDILEQSWENKSEIAVEYQLDNLITRKKREIARKIYHGRTEGVNKSGGTQEQDATKEEYRELARNSLKTYQKTHNEASAHTVVTVEKVTTQVVSGIMYMIDFIAAPKSCAHDISSCDDQNPSLKCHSKLWPRPWLRQNKIDVACKSNHKRNKRSANLEAAEQNNELNELTVVEITELDERGKRQAAVDDDYIDEDIRYYYAERAIQQLNEQVRSNNLYKLITIHTMQNSIHMGTPMVRMYIEAAETYCLRQLGVQKLADCEEMDGNNHRLCLVRLWPSPEDNMVIQQVSIVCDDDVKFEPITGLSVSAFLKAAIKSVESSSDLAYKLVHQGEPHLIPSLESNMPNKLNFIVRSTNCSKHYDEESDLLCYIDPTKPAKACSAFIWMFPNSRKISQLTTSCAQTEFRQKRSISMNPTNASADDIEIQKMVKESLEKIEMTSAERYKQKVLKINGYSTKVTSGKVTTIDFDVGFTSCLKYEWVDDVKTCEVLEHLPRRHCISEVWERLWLNNGRDISVRCEDEETPLEAHVEFESAATAMALANRALKHIEAKYPHPRKQKVVRIYSLDKQVVAGVHYRMKMEVGITNCSALSGDDNYCKIDARNGDVTKFCRVNVWLRPWTDHPPNFRVSCDYQGGALADLYHQIQAEHLFRDFLATYSPEYINDHDEMQVRFEVFKANIRRIHDLNIHERGTATYGVTRFADLTYEEFTKKHMGLKTSLRDTNQVPMRKAQIPSVDIPDTFDWREHGAVTQVKDQGSCGSCWAFSVTGNIEGQWQLKSGKLVSLSEQELVDCDKMDDGCNGGLPDNAYRAIEQLGGLETETDYPYEGEDDKCAYNTSLSRVQISGAVNITSNETEMAKWLVKNGPISIGINANAMQFYMGGVSHPWKMLCSPSNLDHGVLIVGYGIKNYPLFHKQLPYWIVKNSWGPSWGEKGYYRVFRGDGTCGVNKMASSAII